MPQEAKKNDTLPTPLVETSSYPTVRIACQGPITGSSGGEPQYCVSSVHQVWARVHRDDVRDSRGNHMSYVECNALYKNAAGVACCALANEPGQTPRDTPCPNFYPVAPPQTSTR